MSQVLCLLCRCAFFLLIVYNSSRTSVISEREAVLRFLSNSSDIRLVMNDRKADSIDAALVRSGWLPQVTTTVSAKGIMQDADVVPEGSSRKREVSGAIGGSQAVPGGGAFGGSISHSVTQNLGEDDANTLHETTSLNLNFRQPLLRGAGRFGVQDYAWTLKRVDHRIATLNEKKMILSKISTVRKAYWDLYLSMIAFRIQRAEVDYASRRLLVQRGRLSVGSATILDTLSAALELLKAKQALLEAEIVLGVRQRELARLLDMSADSLYADSTLAPQIGDIPPPDEFVACVERCDPQLRIFEALREKHLLEIARQKNLMLPALDVSAGYSGTISSDVSTGERNNSSNALVSLIASYALPANMLRLSVKKAQLAAEKSSIEREKYLADLPRRLEALRQQWERDRQRVILNQLTEEVARKNMEAAEKRFELGTIDNLTLLKARNDYITAAIGSVRSQVEMKKIEIDIQEITGKTLNEFGVEWQ